MNKYFRYRIVGKKSLYISLVIGLALSLGYIIMDVFPYRMYDGNPYNMWIGTYTMSQFQHIFFLLIPIIASMPIADIYYSDREAGYISMILTKGKGKEYFTSLFKFNFLTGGLCILIPLIFNLYCCFMLLPNIKPDIISDAAVNVTFDRPITIFPELYYSHPLLHVAIYLVIDFLLGGMFASIGLISGFFLKNKFFVILFPFVLNYVLTMAAYQIPGFNKYVPERFAIELGGCDQIIPIIVILGAGIGISSTLYLWLYRKKMII